MLPVRRAVRLICLVLILCSFATSQELTNDAIESKINALLGQMTVEEKAGQLTQLDGANPKTLELVKQGQVGSLFNVLGAEQTSAAQRVAVEQSRLKIPLIFGYDVIHGYRTTFPVPLASA